MAFGKDVRRMRLCYKISLIKFAEMLDLSPTYVSLFEREKTLPPSVKVITKIAVILKIDPDVTVLKAGKIPLWIRDLLKNHPKETKELLGRIKESIQQR